MPSSQKIPQYHNHLISREILAFIIDRQARNLSPRSIEFYTDELRRFESFLTDLHIRLIYRITPDLIRQYLIELSAKRNPGGVAAAYRSIKAWLNWYTFEIEDPSYQNPIRKIHAPKVKNDPLPGVSLDQIHALLLVCPRNANGQRDRAMILTLLDSGLRKTEFTNLNYGDLDLKTGAVHVRSGKGNKDRTVFLGSRSRREIIRYLRYRGDLSKNSPLWATSTAVRLTPAGLRQVIRRLSARAGIPEPQIHDFRRTYAIECLRNGYDLITLMRLMGHTDTKVLQRYLRIIDTDLIPTSDRKSPADAL